MRSLDPLPLCHLDRRQAASTTLAPTLCHLDRRRKEPRATEAEWRDPEDVSPAMLMQGVLLTLPGAILMGHA